jgi:hypothetical protein
LSDDETQLSLSFAEQRQPDFEVATLAKIFKMNIAIAADYYNIDTASPCSVLSGTSCNADWCGRLTLCCNLAGYRGAITEEPDVAANLDQEDFSIPYTRLRAVAKMQLKRRRDTLAAFHERGETPDLTTGSPCAFCLHNMGKVPWRDTRQNTHPLPLLPQASATRISV